MKSSCNGSKQAASRIIYEFWNLVWDPDSVIQLVGKMQLPKIVLGSAHGQSPRVCLIDQKTNCRSL